MRISKVNIKFLAIGGVLVLLAASLSGLITRSADPFKPLEIKASFKSLDAFYDQDLKWSDCYGSFKCAMYQVPINYDDVASGNFQIAVMKHEAANAVGNLVINPGGPGGSGVDYAYSYQDAFTPEIIKNFNIVGFDPRGVGRSAPIKCLTAAQTDQLYSEVSFPENDAELAQLKADSAAFAAECKDQNQYLQFYSTANAARDLDILRALLGDKRLNYLGKSYGTYLGTLYAQLFPNNVGKFVLDGAVDPTINSMEQSLQQAVGFDSAFKAFAEDCKKDSSCVFNGDAVNQMEQKLTEIRKSPIEVGSRKLTESLVMYGIAFGLYDVELGWPELRSALKDLFAGNGKSLLAMADTYTGRDSNGQYSTNEAESLIVIACDDFPPSKMDAQATKAAAPLFGKYVVYGDMNCDYLPKANYLSIKNKIELPSVVLVIGNANDPATPYKWAVKLAEILQGSKLISLESDGHTGYNRGSACVDQTVEKYLISGVIPAQNLACSA